jgi:tetratricopeptide (TPR) repeat protein
MLLPPRTFRAELLREQGRLNESLALWEELVAEMRALGQTSFLSTILCEQALTHYRSGRLDEAERLAIEGEELGAEEDVVNFAWGRSVRARVAADRGDHDDAEKLARSALEYGYRTDFPRVLGEVHETLAYVLVKAGRVGEARAEYERTLDIWERYDWLFKAERVRELLVEL